MKLPATVSWITDNLQAAVVRSQPRLTSTSRERGAFRASAWRLEGRFSVLP